MGMAKRDHMEAIASMPEVVSAWQAHHDHAPSKEDIDRLYSEFLRLQVTTAGRHARLIPGALDAVQTMRRRGMRIGTTTGYPRAVMAVVVAEAARQGYRPDCVIAAEDTPRRAARRPFRHSRHL